MKLSVIVCTHNPRPDTLGQTIAQLQRQNLPAAEWELLVIDNASTPPLRAASLTEWHPHGRVIGEPELGLTPARLAGIGAARGESLVFVDDDNWLEPDYLANADALLQSKPFLGAIGGQNIGVFEQPPNEWQRSYLWLLAVREFDRATWSNDMSLQSAIPTGAGLVIRRAIAQNYADVVARDPAARALDRKGETVLLAGGDTHLNFCATQMGYGIGVFPELKLRHFMPKRRLELDYLVRVFTGTLATNYLLSYVFSRRLSFPRHTLAWWRRQVYGRVRNYHHGARFLRAELEAEHQARQILAEFPDAAAMMRQEATQ